MPLYRFLIILFLGMCLFAYEPVGDRDQAVAITIDAAPLPSFRPDDPSQLRFGSLEFRGGLVLRSPRKSFGGISALRVNSDGEHFIALSDRASWFEGRIVYEHNRPVGIAGASTTPVIDEKGNPAYQWDTESLAVDSNSLYVGLERINCIYRFDFDWKAIPSSARSVSIPPALKDLPFNQGLEAMVFVPKNLRLAQTLVAFSEKGLTEEGNLKAFLIGGPTPGMFTVKRTDDYDISDAAILPGGDILILERRYSLLSGVSMRIRRIRLGAVKPDALVEGSTIIETDSRDQVDNMEALSVHSNTDGETVLTVMSDDNFSPLQRTLLLQFALKEK
jgi:hypothetical protein